jgi:hypothetical protein
MNRWTGATVYRALGRHRGENEGGKFGSFLTSE